MGILPFVTNVLMNTTFMMVHAINAKIIVKYVCLPRNAYNVIWVSIFYQMGVVKGYRAIV